MRHALITVFLLASVACSHQGNSASVDEYVVDCTADASQFASDESFVKFIEAEAARRVMSDDCKSPQLLSPEPGGSLSAAVSPIFIFIPTHTCAAQRSATPVQGCAMKRKDSPAWLSALKFGASLLEGTAEAHCGAFTGENYLFRLTRTGDSTPLYTAMLSVTSFSPDPGIWRRALSGRNGQMVSVTIERAIFFHGSINDGPYVQSQPYPFTVSP